MATENIPALIESLSPQEQDAVREFIQFLKAKNLPPPSPFIAAVSEFVRDHPELLKRLAE